MTQRVNLPSPAQVVLIRQGLLLGDPGEGTGEGAGDGAGGSFSREDSVSAGVNGRAETTHSAVGCGTCVSITSQAGGLGPAPVEPEAAGNPLRETYSKPRYPAETRASRELSLQPDADRPWLRWHSSVPCSGYGALQAAFGLVPGMST